jgi:hypothetical protein
MQQALKNVRMPPGAIAQQAMRHGGGGGFASPGKKRKKKGPWGLIKTR